MRFNTLFTIIEGREKLKAVPAHLKPVSDFLNHIRAISREGTAPFRRYELEEAAEKMLADIADKLSKNEYSALKQHVLELVDLTVNGYGDTLFGYEGGDFDQEIASARPRPSPGFTPIGMAKNEAEVISNRNAGGW